MRKTVFIVLTSLYAGQVWADVPSAEDLARQEAEAVVEECWAKSQEDRDSGVTSRMRHGTLSSALCIRDHILYLFKTVIYKGNDEEYFKAEMALDEIKKGTGKLYWSMNNNNAFCAPFCGSMNHVLHNAKVGDVMEATLHDVYQIITEYDPDYFIK